MSSWADAARSVMVPTRRSGARDQGDVEPLERADEGAVALLGDHDATTLDDAAVLEAALRDVGYTLARAMEQADPPLTPVQLRTLLELSSRGATTVGDVASAIGVVPSTASRLADRLVAAGLVSRRAGNADRRQVDLALTPAGAAALADVVAVRALALAATVGRMDDRDRSALLQGARAFAAAHACVVADGP